MVSHFLNLTIPYFPLSHLDVDMYDLMKKYKTKKTIEERQKVLANAIAPTPPSSGNPRKKGDNRKKEEYTIVSPTAEAEDSELTQSMPNFAINNAKHTSRQHPKQNRSPSEPAIDGRNKPLPPTPGSASSTPKQPSPRHSPNMKKAPIPVSHASPMTSTKPVPPAKVLPDSPENVYENTPFGGRTDFVKKKKSPIPDHKSSPTLHVQDVQEPYENVGFGDSGGEAMYANVSRQSGVSAKPRVAARKKKPANNGKEENGHIQVNNQSSPSYQNVDHNDKNASSQGAYYQNITHSRRTVTGT